MDPALSLQQLELLLWCGFDPWPGNFHMLMAKVPPGGKKKIVMTTEQQKAVYLKAVSRTLLI